MKRTYKELFILLLTFSIIFSSVAGAFFAVPDKVYAADEWESVTQDDLVTAFRYYCKSRNLTIDGSISDALTSFTTTTFNNICNTLGIDVTSLQADLKKTVEGNLGLRFLMNQQGVLAYNRIFAEFLQNNDLEVGDSNVNKNVYSGKYFITGDNEAVLIFISNTDSDNNAQFDYIGTCLNPDGAILYNMYIGGTHKVTYNFTDNVSRTYDLYYFNFDYEGYNYSSYSYAANSNYNSYKFYDFNNTLGRINRSGGVAIHYNTTTQEYKAGYVSYRYYYLNSELNSYDYVFNIPLVIDENDVDDANINIVSNNINNNTYNNNWTIIFDDGDTYISDDDDEPSPTTTPGGGGGGGGDDPADPDVPSYDPYPGGGGPSTPGTTTTGSDGVFKLPDIGFDLPDIDWSLKNIGDKFPFCIPGDIVSVLTLLNADPEAPKIQATVPIPHIYDWEIDIDFSDYDRYAFIVRTVEFLGFVISLIYLTIRMVKG